MEEEGGLKGVKASIRRREEEASNSTSRRGGWRRLLQLGVVVVVVILGWPSSTSTQGGRSSRSLGCRRSSCGWVLGSGGCKSSFGLDGG